MWRLALVVLWLAVPAYADDGVRRESLEVGQTIQRDVGYAIGVTCDEDVVTAELKTDERRDTNVLVVTGKRVGKTTCRAGTNPAGASYVYEFTVTKKPRR